MNVLVLTLFVSLSLAAVAVAAFIWTVRRGTHDHLDQLSLLPIEDDPAPTPEGDDRRNPE